MPDTDTFTTQTSTDGGNGGEPQPPEVSQELIIAGASGIAAAMIGGIIIEE